MLDRLTADLAAIPPTLVTGPAAARITAHFTAELAQAGKTALAALDGQRYLRLLDDLDALLARPPLTPLGGTQGRHGTGQAGPAGSAAVAARPGRRTVVNASSWRGERTLTMWPAGRADWLLPSRCPRWPPGHPMPQLCFHPGQLVVHVVARGERIQLGLDLIAATGHGGVLQRAGGQQLIQRAGPGLHLLGLVLRALDGHADVAHLLGDPGDGLADAGLGLRGGIGRLDRLLAGPERLHLRLQALGGGGELVLLRLQRASWPCRSPICDAIAARRVSASRARSSRPAASACCAWPWSLAADCYSWSS